MNGPSNIGGFAYSMCKYHIIYASFVLLHPFSIIETICGVMNINATLQFAFYTSEDLKLHLYVVNGSIHY